MQIPSDAVHEGEALAAALVKAGIADAVASEDTDVLLCASPYASIAAERLPSYDAPLLRHFASEKLAVERLDPAQIRDALGFSVAQMIDWGLLIGTDFAETIPGIGIVRAETRIRSVGRAYAAILTWCSQHGSIEAVVEALATTRFAVLEPEEYLEQVREARAIFAKLPEVPTGVSFEQRAEDTDAVNELLDHPGEGAIFDADDADELLEELSLRDDDEYELR